MLTLGAPAAVLSDVVRRVLWLAAAAAQLGLTCTRYARWLYGRHGHLGDASPQYLLSVVGWFLLTNLGAAVHVDAAWGLPLPAFCFGCGVFFYMVRPPPPPPRDSLEGGGGGLWTACGQRRVDSENSQTTPATTSTSSIRQLLGAADAQTAHPATSSTAPAHQTTGLRERGNDTSTSTPQRPTESTDPTQHALLAVGHAVGAGVGLRRCLWGRVRAGVLRGRGVPPPPLCDIPSGGCSFTGPWTVTRSSLHRFRSPLSALCSCSGTAPRAPPSPDSESPPPPPPLPQRPTVVLGDPRPPAPVLHAPHRRW